jgi:DNA-binding response OmpR family regulator
MSPQGTILIVEDDSSTRLLLQAIVLRNHFQPIIAIDGRSAQAMLAVSVFDAILLDLRLPEVDGGTILRGLDGPTRRHVLILTAAPQSEWQEHLDSGAWCVIQKPFDIGELEEALLACLAAGRDEAKNAGDQEAERLH